MAYYRIVCDGYTILDTRSDEFTVMDPKFQPELNTVGTLSFDIAPTHPNYNRINKITSVIALYMDDEIQFKGRCMDDSIGFDRIKHIECEGELAYFLDSVVRPYDFQGSVSELVAMFVDQHNAQVGPEKRFTLGLVTVTDPNDYIVRASSDYPNTFDEMMAKTVDLLGGYLRVRYSGNIRYLDYVVNYGVTNDQTIEFGKNILDLSQYIKGADVATRIVPLGAVIQKEPEPEPEPEPDENGPLLQAGEPEEQTEAAEKRLTIKGITGGLDYVEDQDAVDLYGVITKVVTFDDVTTETQLLAKGYQALGEQMLMQTTLEINAVDLHLLGVDVQGIGLGDAVKVASPPHGIEMYMMVSKLERDLANPANDVVTLGATRKTLTGDYGRDDIAREQIEIIKGDYATSEDIVNVTRSAESSIEQSTSEIIAMVSEEYATKTELESYSEQISSEVSQTAENVEIKFNEARQMTESVEDVLTSKIEEFQTYYRFDADGAEIGKANNPFKTRIDNTELAFYQYAQKIAWLSNNTLHITNVEIETKMTIGTYENGYFDLIPNRNGSLSFVWRGGEE